MGQGYYYTLSAIAQSFAAIIALNAVFVIYKLQLLKNQRDEIYEVLKFWLRQHLIKNNNYPPDEADRYMEIRTRSEMLNQARNCRGGYGDIIEKIKKFVNNIDSNVQFTGNVTNWLRTTLTINGITIILSLILLPWRDVIPNILQVVILIVVLILSSFAVLITIHAILYSIELGGIPIIEKIFGKKSKS